MPELPEVETIRRDLAAHLLGRSIKSIHIFSSKTASHSAAFFKKALIGRNFSEINRRGKLLIFKLAPSRLTPARQPDYLLIHLKMTGQLIYLNHDKRLAGGHSLTPAKGGAASFPTSFAASVGGELPNKHTRAWIDFGRQGRLFFNDLRKFGYLKLINQPELARLLQNNYGPEPLTSAFSLSFLSGVVKNRKTKIKALLLNQKIIAGLGNIYVDEVLFAARIKPSRPAGSLKPVEIKDLYAAINKIIKLAIKHRGTTFNNYVDSQGQKGNFSRLLKVYGRRQEKCLRCGREIIKKKIAGRGTHYCANCQN